jgi:uncharacterized membrane protein
VTLRVIGGNEEKNMTSRWIGLVLIVAATVFGVAVMNQLPERVPIHWGINGQVDGYASRTVAVWFMPIVSVGVWLLLAFVPQRDPINKNYASMRGTTQRFNNAIVLFLCLVHGVILMNALDWPISMPRAILIGTGMLFVILGNELGRLRRNSWFGIRLPWTLADEEVWRQSHRVGGRIMLVAGLLMVVVSLITPVVVMMGLYISIVFGMTIGLIGYSYWVAMQKSRNISR